MGRQICQKEGQCDKYPSMYHILMLFHLFCYKSNRINDCIDVFETFSWQKAFVVSKAHSFVSKKSLGGWIVLIFVIN